MIVDDVIKILDKAVCNDIRVYDMKARTPFYDYSIIASVNTSRQGMAAVGYLRSEADKIGLNVRGYSASDASGWFLVDLDLIMVHLFVGKERSFYDLDAMYTTMVKDN